jgi:hypothetical protein
MSKAKKHAIQRKLIKQLKQNPKLIKNRRWLARAGHVDAYLPLTVRLNKVVHDPTDAGCPAACQEYEKVSDDTAQLDLTETFGPEVGVKTTRLVGEVKVLAHFGNPAEGDALGDLRLSVTSADLYASSVPVLENTSIGSTCAAAPSPDDSLQEPPSTRDAALGGYVDSTGAAATPAQLASGVTTSTVFRTAPIHLTSVDIAGSPNIGKANLFTTSNNVRLALHVGAEVNTIFRSSEFGTGMPTGWLPTAVFACDEGHGATTDSSTITTDDVSTGPGSVGHQNVIPVNVTGNLSISPAITTDGRLRLATVTVSSPDFEHSTVDACLQPVGLVSTAKSIADSTTAVGSGVLVDPETPRAVACDASYVAYPTGDFRLAIAGVQELTGTGPDGVSSKFVQLEPDVKVTNLTAEALVGY